MMKNLLFLGLVFLGLLGCKSKSVKNQTPISTLSPLKEAPTSDSQQKNQFFAKLDSNDFKFQSFSAKGSLNFSQNGNGRSADINIRIKKDEIIWFYVNLSIIPVAQGYITPNEIKIKNLITGEYTRKNIEFLNELAGVPVGFKDLQSILVGNKLGSFINDSSRLTISQIGEFFLEGSQNPLKNRFSFNQQYRPLTVDLQDSLHNRKVNLQYSNFLSENGSFVPQTIRILAHANQNNLEIQMDYRRIQLNPEQDYPFHGPDDSN